MKIKFTPLNSLTPVIIILILGLVIFYKPFCPEKIKISNIDEASGIDYCFTTDSLIVANDEGNMFEISRNGKEIRHAFLGDFDLEGVVCTDSKFIFAIEDGALLFVDRKTLNSQKFDISGYNFTDKLGIEGIAINKNNEIYVSIQSKKKQDARILKIQKDKDIYTVTSSISSNIKDSSGMTFYKNDLYVISDKKNSFYKYSFDLNEKIKISKLPENLAQEGIAFDGYGYVYLANDNGGIYKYKESKLFQ